MRNWLVLSTSLLAACGSSTTNPAPTVTCGAGTSLQGDTCVPDGTGSGTNTTCGTGTHLSGTTCVPDGPAAVGAPTITMMTPDHAGATGFILFQITGTNLAGSDPSMLHVFFGDPTNPNCEAEVGAADDTTLAGEVPPLCQDLNVTVTVQTDKGMATTPFHYEALFAIDGIDPNQTSANQRGGYLWIVDPFAALSSPWVVPNDGAATPNAYGFDSIAFDSAGALWGTTIGNSPADNATGTGFPQLATISLADGTVTLHGELTDGIDSYYVSDMKFSGTTLYGWGYDMDAGTESLVTISTTDGTVTPVGAGTTTTFGLGGLAIDSTATIWTTPGGASSGDPNLTAATGELDQVNATTGATTTMQTLDWGIGAPIDAMDYVGTSLVAVVDNGVYGLSATPTQKVYGTTLAIIDPTAATSNISPAFELPALTGGQSIVSGIAMAPATTTIARRVPQLHWTKLAPGHAVNH